MSASPFDFIKSINSKQYMMDVFNEQEYVPFIVNRGFSLFPDTVFQANQINMNSHIDKRMQYDYLYYSIRQGKRFKKWPKKDKVNSENIQLIKQKYKYSSRRAIEALSVLTEQQIDMIKKQQEQGGT